MIRAHLPRFHALLRAGLTIISPALLLYFILTADRRLLIDTVRATNLLFVVAAVLLAVPFFVLKALRWQLILRMWNIRLPHRVAVALVCIGQYLGTVTPGQSGDAVRAWYLRQRGYSLGVGPASVAVDRACDVLITLVVAAISLGLYRELVPQQSLYVAVGSLGVLLLGLGALLALSSSRLRATLHHQLARYVPRFLLTKSHTLISTGGSPSPHHLLLVMLASIAALSWTYVRIYLLFLALAIPIELGPLLTFVALLALVGPVAPGGVGTRDALLVVVLQTTLGMGPGQAAAQALAISMLILLLNAVNVAIGFLYSLRYGLVSHHSVRLDQSQELTGKTAG